MERVGEGYRERQRQRENYGERRQSGRWCSIVWPPSSDLASCPTATPGQQHQRKVVSSRLAILAILACPSPHVAPSRCHSGVVFAGPEPTGLQSAVSRRAHGQTAPVPGRARTPHLEPQTRHRLCRAAESNERAARAAQCQLASSGSGLRGAKTTGLQAASRKRADVQTGPGLSLFPEALDCIRASRYYWHARQAVSAAARQ